MWVFFLEIQPQTIFTLKAKDFLFSFLFVRRNPSSDRHNIPPKEFTLGGIFLQKSPFETSKNVHKLPMRRSKQDITNQPNLIQKLCQSQKRVMILDITQKTWLDNHGNPNATTRATAGIFDFAYAWNHITPNHNPETIFFENTAVHPGPTIKEDFLIQNQISQVKLATKTGITLSLLNRILSGKTNLSVKTAVQLGKFFDVDPRNWLIFQMEYNLKKLAKSTRTTKPKNNGGEEPQTTEQPAEQHAAQPTEPPLKQPTAQPMEPPIAQPLEQPAESPSIESHKEPNPEETPSNNSNSPPPCPAS
jgi:addiction module HigA family antidote